MSYYEGLSCPVCSKPFTADEDIVVCPQCGLPHHRACWKSIGHCYAQEKHGTAEQWSRDQAQTYVPPVTGVNVCPNCSAQNAQYAEFCSRCGQALHTTEWQSSAAAQPRPPVPEYAPYHVSQPQQEKEEYSASESIGGTAANDLAAVVGKNAGYYIPRFRRMDQGGFGGWNWAAFLLAPFWLIYRKQYLLGAIYFCVLIPATIAYAMISSSLPDVTNLTSVEAMMEQMEQFSYFYPCMVVLNIWVALMVLLALKGNSLYFSHCKKKIQSIRTKTPDITAGELGASTGVSAGVAILFFAIWYTGVSMAMAVLANFFNL